MTIPDSTTAGPTRTSRPARALILSAGRGERLRPITDYLPKTMVPIGGRPLLEHNVVRLRGFGIRDFAINLHHLPGVVQRYFGDGSDWDVRIQYSIEPTLLGTAGAAKRLEALLGAGTFLVVYGDNLFDFDLEPLFALHVRAGAVVTLGLYEGTNPTQGGIAALAPDGRVTRFLEKPRAEEVFSNLVSAGVYVMEPEVLRGIPADRLVDFGREVLPALVGGGARVYGVRLEGTLFSVDTPELYRVAQRAFGEGFVTTPRSPVG